MHAATWSSVEGARFSGNQNEFQVKIHAFIFNMQPVKGITFGKRSQGYLSGNQKGKWLRGWTRSAQLSLATVISWWSALCRAVQDGPRNGFALEVK